MLRRYGFVRLLESKTDVMKTSELALTNVQLLNQLKKAGYSPSELQLIFDAYQYCIELCDGFQASGKPFIVHLVRTASILVTLNQEIPVIIAGLLHSVYQFGDFGDGSRGVAPWKQESVKQRVGEIVEGYLLKYYELRWNDDNIISIHARFSQFDHIDNSVLVMRLANELEQSLDMEPFYRSDSELKIQQLENRKVLLIDMADQLGFPLMARQLEQTFSDVLLTSVDMVNCDLRNSNFFSQISARLSLRSLFMRRMKGVLLKMKVRNNQYKSKID